MFLFLKAQTHETCFVTPNYCLSLCFKPLLLIYTFMKEYACILVLLRCVIYIYNALVPFGPFIRHPLSKFTIRPWYKKKTFDLGLDSETCWEPSGMVYWEWQQLVQYIDLNEFVLNHCARNLLISTQSLQRYSQAFHWRGKFSTIILFSIKGHPLP